MCKKIFATAAIVAASLQANAQTLATEYKSTSNGNPISAAVFCADPTAIDYNGRLYVYGTNDHQQYIVNKKTGSNGYGNIKSLVVFSTDDMVNWTFHGTIDVGKVCSWAGQSWAPSAVWRTTSAGKDEFFVYFANGGGSVGVMKSTKSPVGPFTSPNSQPMIRHGMAGVDPCNWLFDPGAVIDSTGQGWIGFGGGDPQSSGSKLWPGNSRIAKLKPSMTAIDGSAVNMPAPYLFEASELNIIGGRFVYTYNTSWSDRNDWSKFEKRNGQPAPSSCSMCYMVSDNPLDPNSWEYRGEYVPNEGNFGMGWGNNHTHLHKFQGKYYLFYHSTVLESAMKDGKAMDGGASGYRSIGVNVATVNESKQTINKMTLNKTGITAIRNLDPYQLQEAETMATCGGFTYEDFSNITKNTGISSLGNDASRGLQLKLKAGAWTQLRKVDFGTEGAGSFMLRAKGTGTVEIRLGTKTAKPAASLDFTSTAYQDFNIPVDPAVFKGVKTVFLVCTAATTAYIDAWQFSRETPDAVTAPTAPAVTLPDRSYRLDGSPVNSATQRRGLIIEHRDGQSRKRIVR